MRRRSSAALFLAFAMAQAACSSSSDAPPARPKAPLPEDQCAEEARIYPSFREYSANLELAGENGVTVALLGADPAPPAIGDNVWTVQVKVNGAIPDDARLRVSVTMPEHGHPSVEALVTDEGNGTFLVEQVHFQMPGFWNATMEVDAGGVTDTVRVGFCAN